MRRFTLMAVMLLMTLCFQSSPAWSLDRFVNLNDGTVLDTVSSLRWLKNANCYSYKNWYTAMSSAANLASSSCGLTDGSIAGDWHLPTKEELRIFTDAGYRTNTLDAVGFSDVQTIYWSSTTYAIDTNYAWRVAMDESYVYYHNKDYYLYVWPVRGGQYWSLGSLVVLGNGVFGDQPFGSVSPGHQFTLKNSGTTTQSVTSMALGGGDPTQFALATGGSSPCNSLTPTLAAGASCTVMVSAKTTTLGSKSANLTVTTTASSANIPLTATILPLTVTYNGNGNSAGSVPSDSTAYANGATVTVLGNSGALAKTGYVFDGWNTTADGSGIRYQPGATFPITAPVTLYADWAAPLAPPSGLVSWWRGEGNGIDFAGGLTLRLMDLDFIAGKVGQAFSLNGIDAFMTVADNAKLNFGTNEFSLAAWIKTTDTRIWQRLVTKRDPTGYNFWYSLVLNSGKVTFEIAGGANITSTVSVADGMWHHIVVTRDPATVSPRKYHLYIDGIENVTLADSGLNLDNTAPLEIGKYSTESYSGIYSGLIDEILLFSRGLTAAEVQNIYIAGSAGLALVPTVSAISPTSGPATGGSQVVITGANLASATAVKFGNSAATGFTVVTDTQITAVSPFSAVGTVDITVTTLGGISAISSADQFTYTMVDQTITFGTAPTIAVGGNGLVSATASSGLAVTFSSQTPSVCSVNNITVTGTAQGTCTIAANQVGDSTYNPAAQQTQSFTITAAVAPTVTTAAATAIASNGATLNATVNANYSSALVSFEYGATTAYGSTTTASPSSVSGGTATPITAAITALAPGSTYHFRLKAVNAVAGTVYGNDATFTTPLPRFVDLNDGAMLDTNNSLRWLQNANCTDTAGGIANADGYLVWDDAQTWSSSLASPACALGDGSKAGDWRLPTIDELQTLVVAPDNYRYDTLNAAGFSNVQASVYWSSSTYADNAYSAWYVSMDYGYVGDVNKVNDGYVWPVRAGQYWSLGSLVILGTVDFGSQSIGSAASGHQFIAKNTAATAQPVSGIALNGTDANQFSVATGGSAPCATLTPNLAAGASCTVMVSAAPTSSGAKTANLTVTTATGSTAIPLTVTAIYSVPAISAVSPSSGFASGGTSVTISGSGLTGATAVKFTATDATSFFVGSDSQLTAASPAGVVGQIVDITVTTPGGTSATSSADQFSYTLQYQAQNQSTNPYTPYSTLAEAITNASAGDEIRAYCGQFDGAFLFVRDIILNGGYNYTFDAKDSLPTTMNGSLTVDGGTAKVDSVTVKGVLTIKSGSLQVNGVMVAP